MRRMAFAMGSGWQPGNPWQAGVSDDADRVTAANVNADESGGDGPMARCLVLLNLHSAQSGW
jgi:hypothetical protein